MFSMENRRVIQRLSGGGVKGLLLPVETDTVCYQWNRAIDRECAFVDGWGLAERMRGCGIVWNSMSECGVANRKWSLEKTIRGGKAVLLCVGEMIRLRIYK